MLFALFFGSANLIYPAFLGIYSGSNWIPSIIGFCLTGVSLPLLGVMAVAKSGGDDVESLARPVSKWYAIFFSVALYLSIGPFFAIPRTGATSYSIGVAPILGNHFFIKVLYALLFFGLSYYLAMRPGKMVDRIGKILTPTLLIIIAIFVIASFLNPAGPLGKPHDIGNNTNNAFSSFPFIAGLIQGYGTLDALASLAFAIIVIDGVKGFGITKSKDITKITLKSGIIAISLLALIYIFIGHIGATSQSLFESKDGQFLLNGITIDGGHVLSKSSHYYLGAIGQIVLAIVIFLACLTTSTGLITACAEYFHKLLPQLSHPTWASIFTLISIFFYFGGLSEIIKWSVPVLYLLYPLTIVLILLVLSRKLFHNAPIVYQTTMALTAIPAIFDALTTLSEFTGLFKLPNTVTQFFTLTIPLGKYSMGWLPFAIIGFCIGYIILQFKTNKKLIKDKFLFMTNLSC